MAKQSAKQSATRVRPKKTTPQRRDAGRKRGQPVLDAVLYWTLEELASVGVAQLSVERIARAAELNKTSIYRRWPTREALIAAALEQLLTAFTETSAARTQAGALLRDALVGLMQDVARFLTQAHGRALLQAIIAEESAPTVAALARRQLAQGAAGAAGEVMLQAVARGELRRDTDPALLLSVLVGALLHRIVLERQAPTRAWIDAVVTLVLVGATPSSEAR